MEADCGTASCPVTEGFYSYTPNVAANAVLLVAFALLVPGVVYLGIQSRTLWLTMFLALGLGFEALAFLGRLLIVRNNTHPGYFVLSLLGSLIGPSMVAASIFTVIPRVLLIYGEGLSPCRPAVVELFLYALIALASVAELVGAVFMAYAIDGVPRSKGIIIIVAGLGVQAVAFLGSTAVYISYVIGLSSGRVQPDDERSAVYEAPQFTRFLRGIELSTLLLVVCSIYRIVEMAGGIDGSLFQNEPAFMVVNGAIPLVSGILLSVFHPGMAFGAAWEETSTRGGRPGRALAGMDGVEQRARASYTPHYAYDPNIGKQRSPQAQSPGQSTSPGLPANPRPGYRLPSPVPVPRTAVPLTAVPRVPRVAVAPRRLSALPDRRVNVQQGMVDTEALW